MVRSFGSFCFLLHLRSLVSMRHNERSLNLNTPASASSAKAEQFQHLQLRSVLDTPGLDEDDVWSHMLQSGAVLQQAQTLIALARPTTAEAEDKFVECLNRLSESLKDNLEGFYRHFGWDNPKQVFDELGETQVMAVDVDHNDSDDRLAILLLSFLVASANLERMKLLPDSQSTVLLDVRTYESSGLTMWRTLQLAARLNAALRDHSLFVKLVVSQPDSVLQVISSYLQIPTDPESWNERHPWVTAALKSDGTGILVSNLSDSLHNTVASVWLLAGLCVQQVNDLRFCKENRNVRLRLFEQSQPGWQSMKITETEVQPTWSFPPPPELAEQGYGIEPSNIRSSNLPYPETLATYMSLQTLLQENFPDVENVFVSLARVDGWLPVRPGGQMLKIAGRPLNVLPGATYIVKKANNIARLQSAFDDLLRSTKANLGEEMLAELSTGVTDDFGNPRPELSAVLKYGTFMADAIFVCLAARPYSSLGLESFTRRLAFVRIP